MNRIKMNLGWLLYLPQLYVLFKFSNYTSYGYLIVFLLAFPMYLTNKLFIKNIEDSINEGIKNFIKELALICALSLLIYLNIYKRFIDANSIMSAILAFSRYVLVFVFTYTFIKYLLNATLKREESKNKLYIIFLYSIPSFIVFILVWLAAYPAIMSPDSIYIWTAVVRNTYDGLHPILYVLGIKALTFIWKSPAVVIIAQILLCSLTFGYVSYTLRKWGLNKYICLTVSVMLPLLPVNAIFSATLWKDIPYTMGLILVSIELVRIIKEEDYYRKKTNIIFFSSVIFFTMAMRHNGPYVIVFTLVVYIIILFVKKMKKQSLISAIIISSCILALFISTSVAKIALGKNYTDYDTSSSIYAIPLQGIMAAYHDARLEITESQADQIERYIFIDEMELHFKEFSNKERWRNFTRTRKILDMEELDSDKTGFFRLYFDLYKQNPVIVLRSYFDQTSIIWCSRDTSYISGMPWYIASAEGFEYIKVDSKLPWLYDKVNDFLYSNPKGIRGFFEHPASMMMLILILAYVGFKKKGVKSLVFILPALLNSLGYMATIEGQCTRYTYVNYTIAIVYFIYVLLEESKSKPLMETTDAQ